MRTAVAASKISITGRGRSADHSPHSRAVAGSMPSMRSAKLYSSPSTQPRVSSHYPDRSSSSALRPSALAQRQHADKKRRGSAPARKVMTRSSALFLRVSLRTLVSSRYSTRPLTVRSPAPYRGRVNLKAVHLRARPADTISSPVCRPSGAISSIERITARSAPCRVIICGPPLWPLQSTRSAASLPPAAARPPYAPHFNHNYSRTSRNNPPRQECPPCPSSSVLSDLCLCPKSQDVHTLPVIASAFW